MRATRDEAFDIFCKWISEGTPLECTLSFPVFQSRFRVRLRELSSDELKLWSDDTTSELVLRLRSWMSFAFGEGRDLETECFDGFLAVIFRFDPEGKEPDFISFTEVIQSDRSSPV
jgi:hypothetical protein